jgi:outer membrane protein TolC
MRRSSPLAGVLFPSLLLLTTAAHAAQPAPAPPPPKPNPAAKPAPRPGAPPPAAAAPEAVAPPVPPKIEVNDPLLAPVPVAPHMLGGWRDALNIISTRSVELAISRQEMERAEGLRRQALAAALPSVNATGSITHEFIRNRIPGSPGQYYVTDTNKNNDPQAIPLPPLTAGDGTTKNLFIMQTAPTKSTTVPENPSLLAQLTVSQPILAPRAWYGIGTAELNIKSAKLSVEDKRRLALAQVAAAIVSVYTAERVAEINRVGLQSALQRLDLAQRKARLGDGTRLDVLRAQQDVSLAKGTLIGGDEALLKAREALGLTLGSSEGYGVPPTISLNEMEQSLRSTCSPGSADQRADVVQARTDLEVAQRGITDAKLAFSPTALVSSTASVTNRSSAGEKNYSWSIQGVLSIPIWEGGARYGALRVARANVEESKLRLDAAQRGASLEATQATRAVAVAEQARQGAEQNRDLAREAARLSTRAFEAGAGTSFDLVDSGRREREAELDLVVREFELVKAKLAALLASASCNY